MQDIYDDPYYQNEDAEKEKTPQKPSNRNPKKKKNSILPFVLVGAIIAFLIMLVSFSCSSACAGASQENKSLTQRVSSLEEKLKEKESEIDDLTRRLTSRDKQYETVSSELAALKSPSSAPAVSSQASTVAQNDEQDYEEEDYYENDEEDYEEEE